MIEEVVVDDVITAPSSSSKKVDDKDLPPIVFVTFIFKTIIKISTFTTKYTTSS